MALVSYRLWRIFGQDTWPPSEWFRDWLEDREQAARYRYRDTYEAARVSEVPDESLAQTLAAPHESRRRFWEKVLELVECPWCLGFWISGAVVLIVDVLYGLEAPALQWFAVSCVVGLIGTNLDG